MREEDNEKLVQRELKLDSIVYELKGVLEELEYFMDYHDNSLETNIMKLRLDECIMLTDFIKKRLGFIEDDVK